MIIPGYPGLRGVLGTREVVIGETLPSASLREGVDAATLARLNRVVNPHRLVIGSRLILPESPGTPPQLQSSRRTWIEGATGLLEHAARNQADPWKLRAVNQLSTRAWLLPDELLYVSATEGNTTALPAAIEEVVLRRLPAVQGGTVVVQLTLSHGSERSVSGRLGPWSLKLVDLDASTAIALQGIHALAEPTLIDLEIEVSEPGSAEVVSRFSQPLQVFEGDYGLEALQVPPETLDPEITGPEDELIASVVGVSTAERRWQGAFQFPTSYFESFPSFFGTRRSYNGSGYIYYHTGLDLFGSTTTPVMAPANGVVAFADFLTVRGNVTYIDHGWGVFSGFLHQSQILVETGQRVEQGELIGYVGGTGRVTGPHLHWEIWVGGVPVNPLEWTADEMP